MSPKLIPTPLSSLRVSRHQISSYGKTPNTSIQKKPLVIYHLAFSPDSQISPSSLESFVSSIGVVVPQWRYTMYSTSHFHSTSHEVLCIANGRARCCFGCEENPERVESVLRKGDVVVIPAGVSHRLMEDLDGGFQMVGCYPPGCNWDMCYGREGEEGAVAKIKGLEWFKRDPIYGDQGPTLQF